MRSFVGVGRVITSSPLYGSKTWHAQVFAENWEEANALFIKNYRLKHKVPAEVSIRIDYNEYKCGSRPCSETLRPKRKSESKIESWKRKNGSKFIFKKED